MITRYYAVKDGKNGWRFKMNAKTEDIHTKKGKAYFYTKYRSNILIRNLGAPPLGDDYPKLASRREFVFIVSAQFKL